MSTTRVSKIAGYIPALLRVIDFNLKSASRADAERVVAWVNRNPHYRKLTKHDKRMGYLFMVRSTLLRRLEEVIHLT